MASSRRLFSRPPAEIGLGTDVVLHLERCMHGTRDVGAICEHVCTDALVAMGFTRGTASP